MALRRAVAFGAALAVLLSGAGDAGEKPAGGRAPAAKAPKKAREVALPKELGAPEYLSELARAMLRRRMERHGRDLSLLVHAVVLLQREVVTELASDIVAEPRLVRPIADGMDDLNAALPERFFVLQDELRDRARQLGDAAKRRDDTRLAEAFGRLTVTCVACHSAYLAPRPAADGGAP